jgi:hypothetical protein
MVLWVRPSGSPLLQASYISFGVVASAIFYQEFGTLSERGLAGAASMPLFILGNLTVVAGVMMLAPPSSFGGCCSGCGTVETAAKDAAQSPATNTRATADDESMDDEPARPPLTPDVPPTPPSPAVSPQPSLTANLEAALAMRDATICDLSVRLEHLERAQQGAPPVGVPVSARDYSERSTEEPSSERSSTRPSLRTTRSMERLERARSARQSSRTRRRSAPSLETDPSLALSSRCGGGAKKLVYAEGVATTEPAPSAAFDPSPCNHL